MSQPKHFNAIEKNGDWVLFTDYQEMYLSFQEEISNLRAENCDLKIKNARLDGFFKGWEARYPKEGQS